MRFTLFGFLLLASLGCSSKNGEPVEKQDTVKVPRVIFTHITRQAGIRFTHTNGSFGKKLLPETMGSGVAFLDYDNDGHQDLLFVNSCYWPGQAGRERKRPEA